MQQVHDHEFDWTVYGNTKFRSILAPILNLDKVLIAAITSTPTLHNHDDRGATDVRACRD